jgi:hypothetical protein
MLKFSGKTCEEEKRRSNDWGEEDYVESLTISCFTVNFFWQEYVLLLIRNLKHA